MIDIKTEKLKEKEKTKKDELFQNIENSCLNNKNVFGSRLSPSHIKVVDSNSNLTIQLLDFWSVIKKCNEKKMILIKICCFKKIQTF